MGDHPQPRPAVDEHAPQPAENAVPAIVGDLLVRVARLEGRTPGLMNDKTAADLPSAEAAAAFGGVTVHGRPAGKATVVN